MVRVLALRDSVESGTSITGDGDSVPDVTGDGMARGENDDAGPHAGGFPRVGLWGDGPERGRPGVADWTCHRAGSLSPEECGGENAASISGPRVCCRLESLAVLVLNLGSYASKTVRHGSPLARFPKRPAVTLSPAGFPQASEAWAAPSRLWAGNKPENRKLVDISCGHPSIHDFCLAPPTSQLKSYAAFTGNLAFLPPDLPHKSYDI